MDDSADDPFDGELLIGGTTSTGSVQSDSEVKSAGRLRWILLGVGVLGVLAFGLAQWPQSEPPPQASAETDADADDPAEDSGSTTNTIREATTTTRRTTTTSTGTDGDATTTAEDSGPLLGEITGLGLAVSGGNGRSLIVDLDTGEQHELKTNAEIVTVIDSTLVTRSNNGARIVLVDLTSPDSDGTTLSASSGGYMDVASTGGDLIWVSASGPDDNGAVPILEAFNLRGEKVDELSIELLGLAAFFWSGSTELLQVEGSGIYRRDGEEFRWVSDGALLAYDAPLALIKKCDEEMRCNTAWFESPNFTDPLPLPALEASSLSRFSIAGGGKWLIRTDWNDGTSKMIEISSGRVAHTSVGQEYYGPAIGFPVSPDGRWLIEQSGSRTTAVDLVNGVEFELDLPSSFDYGPPPAFVEMGRTAFG